MKKLIYRLLKICPCYDYPDKFFTIKIGESILGGKTNNVCMGCVFKCEECGRKLYRQWIHK